MHMCWWWPSLVVTLFGGGLLWRLGWPCLAGVVGLESSKLSRGRRLSALGRARLNPLPCRYARPSQPDARGPTLAAREGGATSGAEAPSRPARLPLPKARENPQLPCPNCHGMSGVSSMMASPAPTPHAQQINHHATLREPRAHLGIPRTASDAYAETI